MNEFKRWKFLPAGIGIILGLFIAASFLDILLAAIHPRFYSMGAFMAIFGVAGIFAALICYSVAIDMAPVKNEWARWTAIILIIISGIVFFFPLATLEGGEYEYAFKSFGVAMAAASLFFVKGKVE